MIVNTHQESESELETLTPTTATFFMTAILKLIQIEKMKDKCSMARKTSENRRSDAEDADDEFSKVLEGVYIPAPRSYNLWALAILLSNRMA